MRSIKVVLAMALTALFALALAACGSSSTKLASNDPFSTGGIQSPKDQPLTGGKRGGVLNVLNETEFEHIDSGLAYYNVDYEVVCLTPQPVNTQGEARAFARLATSRRWDRIVLVTSTYHLARARLLVGRCWHGRLLAVGAGSPWRASEIEHVAVEWTAMLRAWVFDRGC